MSRVLRISVWLLAAAATAGNALAFSLWGPAETWETTDMNYVTRRFYWSANSTYTELGATKNFGEGGRLNVPIITYAYDEAFLHYFGTKGEKAVDAAMAVLNAIPAASSVKLSKYLTQGNQQINYSAQALDMIDLKSGTLGLMLEHMGLIGETHVWDLRVRISEPAPPACAYDYLVINRSFDPDTFTPSPYVNGTLYNYQIGDACPLAIQVADAIEQPSDAAKYGLLFTAVATKEGLNEGGYYLGLTRDDVGGLRFLYRKNNYNVEALDTEAVAGGAVSGSWEIVSTTNTTTTTATGTGTAAATNNAGVYGGVEKIRFVKVHYNAQLSTTFTPVVYHYKIPFVTNGLLYQLQVTRTVTAPDIIISAGDLIVTGNPLTYPTVNRGLSGGTAGYVVNGVTQTSAGGNTVSSVFSPGLLITFNSVGPTVYNENPSYLDQGTIVSSNFVWSSFDGSTNPPVIFPTGSTSYAQLEDQVLNPDVNGQGSVMTWDPVNDQATNATGSTGGAGAQ